MTTTNETLEFYKKSEDWYIRVTNVAPHRMATLKVYEVDRITLKKTLKVEYDTYPWLSLHPINYKLGKLDTYFYNEVHIKSSNYQATHHWIQKSPNPGTRNEVYNKLVKLLTMTDWENNKARPAGGWDASKKKWFPHVSGEGGNDTIAYGHKITDGEKAVGNISVGESTYAYADGITDKVAKDLLKKDIRIAYNRSANIFGETCWADLDFWAKVLYTDLTFNVGHKASRKYPNLRTCLIEGKYGTWKDNADEDPDSWDITQRKTNNASNKMLAWSQYTRKNLHGKTRHKLIAREILTNLSNQTETPTSQSSTQESSEILSTCEMPKGNDNSHTVIGKELPPTLEFHADEVVVPSESSHGTFDQSLGEETSSYSIEIYEGVVDSESMVNQIPVDSFEVNTWLGSPPKPGMPKINLAADGGGTLCIRRELNNTVTLSISFQEHDYLHEVRRIEVSNDVAKVTARVFRIA